MRIPTLFLVLLASPVFAERFDRPMPQAQSATAELWFAVASVLLIAASWLVNHLVLRK